MGTQFEGPARKFSVGGPEVWGCCDYCCCVRMRWGVKLTKFNLPSYQYNALDFFSRHRADMLLHIFGLGEKVSLRDKCFIKECSSIKS